MPKDVTDFAKFLANVPDAPSSDAPRHAAEETPPDPKAPGRDAAGKFASAPATESDDPPAAEADAVSPHRAPKRASADPVSPAASATTQANAPDHNSLLQALRAGDLDTIADLLGEDPAGFDEKTPKWAARQRKEAKLIADRDRVMRQAETVVERWSPVSRLVEQAQSNPAALLELVGLLTGQDPDQAWTAAVRARGSVDPRVPVLTTQLAQKDTRLAEYEAERAARADAAFYETLRDEVDPKSVVRKIEGWEAKVAQVLRDSIDPDLGEPKLSTKQAADRVVRREREEYERRASVFGGDSAPKKPRQRSPERAAGSTGTKIRKLSKEEWLAAQSKA